MQKGLRDVIAEKYKITKTLAIISFENENQFFLINKIIIKKKNKNKKI